MDQEALFYEDFRGAVCHLVKALGGAKRVGGMLRPTLSVKQAESWVNDCLNPDRVTKFDFEDIATLLDEGRKRSIHCAINQLCAAAGYADPELAPIKTPRQKLAEEYARTAERIQQIADELAAIERAETAGEIRSVS